MGTAVARETVSALTVKVDGNALDPEFASAVADVRIRNSLHAPDMAEVRITDPDRKFIKSQGFKLGNSIEISIGSPESNTTTAVFKGFVATLAPEFTERGVEAVMRAYDLTFKLTRGRHTRVFTDVMTTDAITEVLGAGGFNSQVTSHANRHEWLQQSEESDYDFVTRLARTLDFVMVADGDTIVVGPLEDIAGEAATPLEYGSPEKGRRLFSFNPTVTTGQVPSEVIAVAHDPSSNAQWEASVKPFEDNAVLVESDAISQLLEEASEIAGETVFRFSTTAWDSSELERAAKAAAKRLLQTAAQGSGVCVGRPDLKPGTRVQIENVEQFSGKYVVSETTHSYRGGRGYRTSFVCAGPARRSLAELMRSSGGGGATSNGGSGGDFGEQLHLAEVTNNQDPEDMGRVRVKFKTIRDDKSGNPEGWWARIAGPSSGKGRGVMMLPQPGEEVLVGFEQGDVARPLVIGSLFNGEHTPGEELVRNDGSFSLVSDKQIRMKAAEEIQVHSDKELTMKVGGDVKSENDGVWKQKVAKEVTIENGTFPITIKSGKEITLEAPMITVKADMKLDLSGPMVNINGSTSVTIAGAIIKLG